MGNTEVLLLPEGKPSGWKLGRGSPVFLVAAVWSNLCFIELGGERERAGLDQIPQNLSPFLIYFYRFS